jgi:hypothetical protein
MEECAQKRFDRADTVRDAQVKEKRARPLTEVNGGVRSKKI